MRGRLWYVMNSRKLLSSLSFFSISLLVFLLLFQHLLPTATPRIHSTDWRVKKQAVLHYVAIGDSLTEGVGDLTGQGGFVPLLAQSLINTYQYDVQVSNYGVSGNTSRQILKRMVEDKAVKDSLSKADLVTITVGGNDLRQALMKQMGTVTLPSLKKPLQDYERHLMDMIETATSYKAELPIYIIGIYNPFYLHFPEIEALQTIVQQWNATTERIASTYSNVYFVPINEVMSKGLVEEEQSLAGEAPANNVLFEKDQFHPNNIGYDLIKQAVMEKIHATKKEW